MLLRFPAVLAAVLSAAFVLGLAASANSLFFSSLSSAVLARELSGPERWGGGLQVIRYGSFGRAGSDAKHARWNDALAAAIGRLSGLGARNLSIDGLGAQLSTPASGAKLAFSVLLTRQDALSHVTVLEHGAAPGVWMAASRAHYLHVGPGDRIDIGVEGASAHNKTFSTRVAGVYQDLGTSSSLANFWTPLQDEILPSAPGGEPPPPFLLAGPRLFERIQVALRQPARWQWNYPVRAGGLTVPEAASLNAGLARVEAEFKNPATTLGRQFRNANYLTSLADFLGEANSVAGSTEGPIGAISIAGVVVALFVVAAAGVFGVHRRRIEIEFLSARGVTPGSLGLRAALEASLPVLVGAAAGWAAARALVTAFGPSTAIGGGASHAAVRATVVTGVIALLLLGVMAGAAARRQTESQDGQGGGAATRVPWEVGLLLLAAASYYEINARGSVPLVSGNGDIHVDTLSLLFPILFVAGAAGVAARLMGRLFTRLRGAPGGKWPPGLYLAARRLAGAPRSGILLLGAVTLSVGILVYAGMLAASITATSRAKAEVFIGSDVATPIPYDASHDVPDLPYPATPVTKLESAQVVPGDFISATVLGIDPETFSSAAFWDGSFARASLDDLVARLDAAPKGRHLPAIVVGQGFPRGGSLDYTSFTIPVTVVATAAAWPGTPVGRPLIVTTNDALKAAFKAGGTDVQNPQHELWIKGDTAGILHALAARHLAVAPVTVDKSQAMPAFLAIAWTLSFLESLGLLTGAVALVGIVLYLQARQRARQTSYALTRRMGLGRGQHRRAVGLELAGMLGPALVIAIALAAVATRLVYQRLDPFPDQPPPALLRWPGGLLGVTGGALVLLTIVAAWLVQRSAERSNMAELMRLAE